MPQESRRIAVPGALAACWWLAACPAAWAPPAAGTASEADWQEALRAIRQVALDKAQTDERRASAVTAHVKLLVRLKRHKEALDFCREFSTKGPDKTPVIDAALRGGCLVARDRSGHLRAELDFLASCSNGPAGGAAAAIGRELDRAVRDLASLSGRKMAPEPVVPRWPAWASVGPGKAPDVLHVSLPRIEPPPWFGQVPFPLIREPGRK